ncbi:MAG: flavodoxin [Arcobacter sp.]|uniref:flavodoxin n=1 Tax=uncultured Arcobacter sp. TaxID=165434 RepID=UPI000CC04DD8|nr:flavodoxin [uncultured Arcobacter sp.]PLY08535.1 MAG: flavodoxin [Arcobacter sp.]
MTTAIFYASSTGNTSNIANIIAGELAIDEIYDIADISLEKINEYSNVILGVSTWGDGDLQDDWDDNFEELKKVDFSSKTVAFFGLGDQDGYPDTYLDAMGILYEQIKSMGAKIIGEWEIDESYSFDESKALIDNRFVGLALDEDTQDTLTNKRVKEWTTLLKKNFN